MDIPERRHEAEPSVFRLFCLFLYLMYLLSCFFYPEQMPLLFFIAASQLGTAVQKPSVSRVKFVSLAQQWW